MHRKSTGPIDMDPSTLVSWDSSTSRYIFFQASGLFSCFCIWSHASGVPRAFRRQDDSRVGTLLADPANRRWLGGGWRVESCDSCDSCEFFFAKMQCKSCCNRNTYHCDLLVFFLIFVGCNAMQRVSCKPSLRSPSEYDQNSMVPSAVNHFGRFTLLNAGVPLGCLTHMGTLRIARPTEDDDLSL